MIRSCIRQAVRAFAGAAVLVCATAAHSTSFQMNCDSLALTGTPPNQILTCNIGSSPPSGCSIQGPGTGLIGTNISMTAVCTGGTAPLTYSWTGGNAANCTAQACQTSDTGTVNYTATISNAQGSVTTSAKQVVWSNTPIGPSGCALNATPSSLPVGGGSVSLSMDCSGGSGLNYSWTGGFAAGANTQQVSGSVTATTTFSATASNGGGTSTKTATVTVATGGGGGPIACAGYLNTNVYTATWPFTANGSVPMGPLDAAVVKFTTGSSPGSGQLSMTNAPNANATTTHDYALSTQPCDFVGVKRYTASGGPTFRFSVSNGPNIQLLPNTTYYINIRNNDATGCVANGGSCDIYPINLQGP